MGISPGPMTQVELRLSAHKSQNCPWENLETIYLRTVYIYSVSLPPRQSDGRDLKLTLLTRIGVDCNQRASPTSKPQLQEEHGIQETLEARKSSRRLTLHFALVNLLEK